MWLLKIQSKTIGEDEYLFLFFQEKNSDLHLKKILKIHTHFILKFCGLFSENFVLFRLF